MWAKEDLEAVILWMKPRERQALALAALEAGYHVLVPKPPAPSLDDCLALAEASTRTGKSLMVHFHRRFSLAVTKALEIMARPSFGQVTQVSCSFCSGPYDAVRGVGYDGRSTRSCSTSRSTTSTWCVISAARSARPPPSMTSATAVSRSRSPCSSPAARWAPCS